jgi:hypothetical protein
VAGRTSAGGLESSAAATSACSASTEAAAAGGPAPAQRIEAEARAARWWIETGGGEARSTEDGAVLTEAGEG